MMEIYPEEDIGTADMTHLQSFLISDTLKTFQIEIRWN